MEIAAGYYTRSGNTEKLAKAIAKAVRAGAKPVDVVLEARVICFSVQFLLCF